jgi:hypothetical protein
MIEKEYHVEKQKLKTNWTNKKDIKFFIEYPYGNGKTF